MRGTGKTGGSLFSHVDLEARIPAPHPLRKIRQAVRDALVSPDAGFEALHAGFGRPLMAPERLIRAGLFRILFSVRSERQVTAAIPAPREVAPLLSNEHFATLIFGSRSTARLSKPGPQ